MRDEKHILVLGSKPGSRLPNINVSKIYTANGAAERVNFYSKKFGSKFLVAVSGTMEFFKNEEVRKRILSSSPNLIYFRSGNVNQNEIDFDIDFISKSRNDQCYFQSKFLKYGILSVFLSELTMERKFIFKIKHLSKIFSQKGMLGASTGLFSIMLAKYENPNCKIITSGIGIQTIGDTFYGTKGTVKRSSVDRKIFSHLNSDFKKNLITTDIEMANYCNIPLYKSLI